MAIISPTITTNDPAVYETSLREFLEFAPRIQIDIADGVLAPSQTLTLNQLYWPKRDERTCLVDLHLMLNDPADWLDQIISLQPDKVILHAESINASKQLPLLFQQLHRFGIASGVALLPATKPGDVSELIALSDSVLIFGGHLGYQGGAADLSQLEKIGEIKAINSSAMLEWDGGANKTNVAQIAGAGINQINVGSAISNASNRQAAYYELAKLVI